MGEPASCGEGWHYGDGHCGWAAVNLLAWIAGVGATWLGKSKRMEWFCRQRMRQGDLPPYNVSSRYVKYLDKSSSTVYAA